MKITVSGKEKEVADGITVKELVLSEKVESPDYVLVTINEEFVNKSDEATTVVKEDDTVEFLYFTGGGR